MPSVAERIYLILAERLRCIRGEGGMANDLQGRVHLRRPAYDLTAEDYPAVFFALRQGSGFATQQRPGATQHAATTLTFDAIGITAGSETTEAGLAGLRLLADLQRALEVPGDLFLRTDVDGATRALLSEELRLVDTDLEPAPPGFPYEIVGVGIACTYPHTYGDPDDVVK